MGFDGRGDGDMHKKPPGAKSAPLTADGWVPAKGNPFPKKGKKK